MPAPASSRAIQFAETHRALLPSPRRSARPNTAARARQSYGRLDFLSSTATHARASFQSRNTVCGDTPSASAVSSTLSPPKYRSARSAELWAARLPELDRHPCPRQLPVAQYSLRRHTERFCRLLDAQPAEIPQL